MGGGAPRKEKEEDSEKVEVVCPNCQEKLRVRNVRNVSFSCANCGSILRLP